MKIASSFTDGLLRSRYENSVKLENCSTISYNKLVPACSILKETSCRLVNNVFVLKENKCACVRVDVHEDECDRIFSLVSFMKCDIKDHVEEKRKSLQRF